MLGIEPAFALSGPEPGIKIDPVFSRIVADDLEPVRAESWPGGAVVGGTKIDPTRSRTGAVG